jgi:hypothetical protein
MYQEEPTMDKGGDESRGAIWLLVFPHLVCCGGTALLLIVGGAGVASAGIVRASIGLLILGFVVVGVGVIWRRRRRSS